LNKKLLNTGVQYFILNNLNTDIMSVLLKKPIFEGITQQELAQQIESKKKCRKKLPNWFETLGIYYPNKLNIEQTSSETTAKYKSEIVSGKSLVDVTGGLGVDSYYFSKKVNLVFHVEVDEKLSEIASYNFKRLGAKNIETHTKDGLEFLKNSNQNFDWMYLDPSRRNETKGKVFRLSDCLPDVSENLKLLYTKSQNILLKTSPLLDISIGLNELNGVKEIHCIAVDNEVKELLWVLRKDFDGEIDVYTVNFTKSKKQVFNFSLLKEKSAISDFNLPLSYLYEPNTAILKSGAFKSIGVQLNVKKLHTHTHLYTSKNPLDFPGRCFKLLKVVNYNSKNMKALQVEKANISVRNFPITVATLRKKFKIKDGGGSFLFFFKNVEDIYQVALCRKI